MPIENTIIEIGSGQISNCSYLFAHLKYGGVIIDGSSKVYRDLLLRYGHRSDIDIIPLYVTAENVNGIFIRSGAPANPGILSIDIDGMDYWIWKALEAKPSITVIEYNASFGPELSITIPYKPRFDRMKINPVYYGASLTALTKLAWSKDMALIGCESAGCNAFFLRRDLLTPEIREVAPITAYYPARRRQGTWRDQIKYIKHLEYVKI